MEEVATKLYEATQDFVLQNVNPETGEPAGETSYVKGEKYRLPEQVAALAPEGALQEVAETQPTPPVPPAEPTPPTPPVEPPAPPVEEKKPQGWVGGHSLRDE